MPNADWSPVFRLLPGASASLTRISRGAAGRSRPRRQPRVRKDPVSQRRRGDTRDRRARNPHPGPQILVETGMRSTPFILVVLGLILIAYAVLNLNLCVLTESFALRDRKTAREAAKGMSDEDVRRVFEMPPDALDREVWLENHFGRADWAGIQQFLTINTLASGALGVVLCFLGCADSHYRGRHGASIAAHSAGQLGPHAPSHLAPTASDPAARP